MLIGRHADETARSSWPTPSTSELREMLDTALAQRGGSPCRVARLERRRSDYASSFAIEELAVQLSDGRRIDLLLKDLTDGALLEGARAAKPEFLRDPRREIEIYLSILPDLHLGTADCYAAVADEERQRFWLILEKVPGVELYQVGELETWQRVARWLATAHSRLAPLAAAARGTGRLIRYDVDLFLRWADRARELAPAQSRHRLDPLLERYEAVIELLASLPRSIVHGEFYASNILVVTGPSSTRVCPVDWEMAGTGPALLDLAALTAGSWTEAERREIARAYLDAAVQSATWTATPEAFQRALDCCRLYVAVQWLGWSANWSPPAAHRRDWLDEALRIAARLFP